MKYFSFKNVSALLLTIGVTGFLSLQANAVLVHHYNIEGDAAGTLVDSIGSVDLGYDDPAEGSLGAAFAAPGTGSTQGFQFVAGGDATSTNADDLFMSTSFSVAAWVQNLGTGGSARPMIVGVIENGSGFNHNYTLRTQANGTGLAWFSRDSSGTTMNLASTADISDNAWHHVAATLDWSGTPGDSMTGTVYVDGVQTGTETFASWNGWNAAEMTQGGLGQSGFTPNENIDDVQIYDNVLTPAEVSTLAGTVTPVSLALEVNTTTGGVTFTNGTGAAIDIDYYEIRSASGSLVAGGSSLEADFNTDGNVNGTDFAAWQGGYGTAASAAHTEGDADLDGDVDGADFLTWQEQFGESGGTGGAGWNSLQDQDFEGNGAPGTGNGWEEADNSDANALLEAYLLGSSLLTDGTSIDLGDAFLTSGLQDLTFEYHIAGTGDAFISGTVSYSASASSVAAVPEPSTIYLLFVASIVFVLVSIPKRMIPCRQIAASILCLFMLTQYSPATVTNDRVYRMGDDDSGVMAGGSVSFSTDTAGSVQELSAFSNGGSFLSPTYVDTSDRPMASAGELGIQFDATNLQVLDGDRLGFPETSIATEDYTGIVNRGFQLWVKPEVGASANPQDIVMDTTQHGVRINAAGRWAMVYGNGNVFASNVDATTNTWHHVMVVRPFGATGPNGGSRLYVDGVAVAAAAGGYNTTDDFLLAIGGATSDSVAGESNNFTGIVDDLEIFVVGTTTSTPAIDYGTFDLATDNQFIANALSGFVSGDINGDGAVNGDGTGNANTDDISAFVDNWLFENRVNGVLAGDINTRMRGDFDFNGIVDLDDWHVLRTNHITNAAGINLGSLIAGASVPEPASWVLLTLGCLFIVRWRTK